MTSMNDIFANMTPTADESARIMAADLRAGEPFSYWRFGDGFLELMAGHAGGTCDGERYTPKLRASMGIAAESVLNDEAMGVRPYERRRYVGDWLTASFRDGKATHCAQWNYLLSRYRPKRLLHFEALLLMRCSLALEEFYRTVREDQRRKVVIGRDSIAMSWALRATSGIQTPMTLTHDEPWLLDAIERARPEVILFGVGMAGMIPIIQYWAQHPDVTVIHLGSALDPLCSDKPTRTQQISHRHAVEFFESL